MASPNIYPNGTGGVDGDKFATGAPVYMSGNVWYVSSATGVNAAGRGLMRSEPVETLAYAHGLAVAGDEIHCLGGHSEILTAAVTLNKARVKIVSEGVGSDAATFVCNAAINMFDLSAIGIQIRGLRFPAATAAPTSKVNVGTNADLCVISGCTFYAGALDTCPQINFEAGADGCTVEDTVLEVTSATTQPTYGILIVNAVTDYTMRRVTFNGGSVGWSTYAFNSNAGAITGLTATDIDLLNNSDMVIGSSTVGRVSLRDKSGSARVVWNA